MPFNGTIVISQNPVTSWERYSATFGPGEFTNFHPEKRADFGHYRNRFRLYGDRVFLSEMLLRGLGRDVSVHNGRLNKIWEGFIFALTLNVGGAEINISLEDMANLIWLRYRLTGTTITVRSTAIENLVSQGRFGEKEFVMTGGELESASVADQVAQRYLNELAWPQPAPVRIIVGGSQRSGDRPFVEVQARGYMDTLNWRVFNHIEVGVTQGVSAEVGDIVTDVGQFVAGTEISSNSTPVTKNLDQDRRAGDLLADLARLGDGAYQRYIVYMTNGRKLVYEPATQATLRI